MDKFRSAYRVGQGVLGGVGAMKGAQVGAQYDNPIGGAVGGAAVGALALPVGWGAAKAVGSMQVGAARSIYEKGRDFASSATMPQMPTGPEIFAKAEVVGGAIKSRAPEVASKAIAPIKNYDGMFANMYKYDKFAEGRKFEMTGKGKGFFLGAAALGGAKEGMRALETSRLGSIDPGINRATPQVPFGGFQGQQQQSFGGGVNHAGATGDLAFALSNNRRG